MLVNNIFAAKIQKIELNTKGTRLFLDKQGKFLVKRAKQYFLF
jgi:hypothetical protein